MIRLASILMFVVILAGCAGARPRGDLPKSVAIEFKGKAGEKTDTRYFSNARILTFEGAQLVKDRTEGVDFTTETNVTDYNDNEKILKYVVKTTRKDGTVELHDMAFPELNEEIDYVMRGNGEILRAGHWPPQSLFFVPSMPIPVGKVEVGDTWTMAHTWYSARDAIPLQLDVIGILKDIVTCEGGHVCADVEVSGHVNLVAKPTTVGSEFESRLWGRLLFSLDRGDVIWSEMRSRERFGVPGQRMDVRSCMLSETHLSTSYKTNFACEPDSEELVKAPAL